MENIEVVQEALNKQTKLAVSLIAKLEIAMRALVAISDTIGITGQPTADAQMASFAIEQIKKSES